MFLVFLFNIFVAIYGFMFLYNSVYVSSWLADNYVGPILRENYFSDQVWVIYSTAFGGSFGCMRFEVVTDSHYMVIISLLFMIRLHGVPADNTPLERDFPGDHRVCAAATHYRIPDTILVAEPSAGLHLSTS